MPRHVADALLVKEMVGVDDGSTHARVCIVARSSFGLIKGEKNIPFQLQKRSEQHFPVKAHASGMRGHFGVMQGGRDAALVA